MNHAQRWTPTKIRARLALIRPLVHRDSIALEPLRYTELADPDAPPPIGADVDDSRWPVIEHGDYWGAQGVDFVFRTAFTVPSDWPIGPVALHLPMGVAGDIFTHPESLLYVDGAAIASADRYHHLVRLPSATGDGQRHSVTMHGWTGLAGWPPDPSLRTKLFMGDCRLVLIDEATERFIALADCALDTAEVLRDERPERHRLLNALDAAFLALDTRDPLRGGPFHASVPGALELLKEGIAAAGPPMDLDIIAVGHAHMDIAYLWRVNQMRRKNARTYSNVLRMMAANPDYHYSHNQPQLYRYTETDYPELFERIRARVADGRWEPMGAAWVEPDTNITGGESLVRQLLLGRRYFSDTFGDLAEQSGRDPGERIDTPVLWLPDTFGFTWSLPQLMAAAGIRWFMTGKVNWNQHNRMPAQNFMWQGIDGTRVLAHLLTTPRPVQHLPFPTTYKAEVTPAEVLGSWTNFTQKHAGRELLMVYGYGDGGGGPTQELVSKARIMGEMPGMPRVRMGTVREFYENLEAAGTDSLPVWNDELYMEGHRGVLTTHADMKRANRRAERLLHRTELACSIALVVADHPCPHGPLRRAWELLCLNQFHDIVTGTAVPEVFVDAHRDYAEIGEIAAAALRDAHRTIGTALHLDASDRAGVACLIVNAAPVRGGEIVCYEPSDEHSKSGADLTDTLLLAPRIVDTATGSSVEHQDVEGGRLFALPPPPPLSVTPRTFRAVPTGSASAKLSSSVDVGTCFASTPGAKADRRDARAVAVDGGWQLENTHLRLEFDDAARLFRVFDRRADRDVLAAGRIGNELQAFEDRPLNWDAWDIDTFFEDRLAIIDGPVDVRVVEDGPLRAALRIERRYRSSTLVQHIRLERDARRVDFATEVDWHESHTLLKVAFPVAVLAPRATYEIQWGSIERPTHRNTSWDAARFEVAAQQWVDLSEGGFGVALLNDCKYGHDVHHDVIRLSLIKSPTSPDPHSDQGVHRFTYSLLPHAGDWRDGCVIAEARRLNDPLRLVTHADEPAAPGSDIGRSVPSVAFGTPLAIVTSEARNAVVETIKPADDGDGLVVRLYESERRRGPVRLRFGAKVTSVAQCNLLEEDHQPVELQDDAITLNLGPFEIVSLRVRFGTR